MTSVSVALATYNGASYLREQLDSLAAQSLPPDEVVITDDDSTDDTMAILTAFAATAPFPVHIHRNESRVGYRANFIRAMELCQSDVVALCDQDDVWDAEKLKTAVQSFADPDVALFFHNAWLIDKASSVIGPANIFTLPTRNVPLSFFPMVNPYGFSIVFRRSLSRFAKYWSISVDNVEANNRMAHDQWIFFLASVLGVIVYSDERLVRYRQHGGNAYGWHRQAGLRHRLQTMLRDNGADHRQFSHAAEARARVLKAIADAPLSQQEHDRVKASAAYYDALAYRLALRARVYTAPRVYQRIMACLRLVSAGGYNRGTMWNIGPKAMLKDIVLGLIFRPLMTRGGDQRTQESETLRQDIKVASSSSR